MGLRYHLAYLSSNNYNFTVSAALSRDICCIIRSRENADEEFLTERCGAEGAVTPLIVNNNKYLARRSPSSLSQSYQCVNNTPTSDQMCLQQHLWFLMHRDCQHSSIPMLALSMSSRKKEKKERSDMKWKWFLLPGSPEPIVGSWLPLSVAR